MSQYRLKRRHFLLGLGSVWGARLLLTNIEAAARCEAPPARLLFVHWPGGTIQHYFRPTTTGRDFTFSPILQPFETAGLRDDTIVLFGSNVSLPGGVGGGAERGTVMMTTGTVVTHLRPGRGGDDPAAGGPSFDQVFQRHVRGLSRGGSLNVLCDLRTDAQEISTRCLSYGYETQEVEGLAGQLEYTPRLPDTSPYEAYMRLFAGFAADASPEALARGLAMKQSVLDSAQRELDRLYTLVAVSEREKLDAHAEAIRELEQALSNAAPVAECSSELVIDPALVAKESPLASYVAYEMAESDTPHVQQLSDLFFQLIRTGFQCDLFRVATFQWCPSTNHMAFPAISSTGEDVFYAHHPYGSVSMANLDVTLDETPDSATQFLIDAQIWFNQRLADALSEFKNTTDVYGTSLLDSTIVPFMTEKAHMNDNWNNLPALVLGGRALGMQGGQYLELDNLPHNCIWMSVAQGLFGAADPLALLTEEGFHKENVAPIDGLWLPP